MSMIESFEYSFKGDAVRVPVAIAGDVSSNKAPTLIIPGWGVRGQERIAEIADLYANTGRFGIVRVVEMPNQIARKNGARALLQAYPEVANIARSKMEDEFHLEPHSMGMLAVNDELDPVTAVVVAGLFPQISYKTKQSAREHQKMRKLGVRFGVIESMTEGGRMRAAGDSFGTMMNAGAYSLKDARNFVSHPFELIRTLAVEAQSVATISNMASRGTKVGFVHGANDPVFPFDEINLQVPQLTGDPQYYDSNVILMEAPANGHPGLIGNIGKIIAGNVADMQDRLIADLAA